MLMMPMAIAEMAEMAILAILATTVIANVNFSMAIRGIHLKCAYNSIVSKTNPIIWVLFKTPPRFHQLGPLGQVGLVVDMSVCLFVCVSPSDAIFYRGLSLVLRLALSSRPPRRPRPSAIS